MSADKPKKRSWVLRIVGLAAVVGAAALAWTGIASRHDSEAKLATWTDSQAVPSVTVIFAKRGEPEQEIVLPGDIQAWNQAPLYARVNGYLKTWNEDIGARVKAGDLLGSIEAPDLDQQVDQARARLATTQSDAKLATLTALEGAAQQQLRFAADHRREEGRRGRQGLQRERRERRRAAA